MTQKEKLDIAEELYYKKFNKGIPRLMGMCEEHYEEDKFIAKIYKAVEANNDKLVLEDYPRNDVDY